MQTSWLVILPPIIVVVLATVTRRVLFSLFVGIVSAALIVNDFQLASAAHFIVDRIWKTTELGKLASWDLFWTGNNIFLCLFLVLLGIIITMIQYSGAAYAYGALISKKLKSARGAEGSSLVLSTLFFIDDYFSCLTVGSVMQPITDQFRVPRSKLALLVNTVAAPLAVLVPLSSWVAEIVIQLRNSGIGLTKGSLIQADPMQFYLATIPFMLYPLIVLVSIGYMVWQRISYGIIATQEVYAQKTGELFGGKMPTTRRAQLSAKKIAGASIIDFLFPIGFLFCSIITWVWYHGNYNSISAGFFVGSLLTCIVTMIFLIARRTLSCAELPKIFKEGSLVMGSSLLMLILIWTLSNMLSKDLATGHYLAHFLKGYVTPTLFPVIFFLMAVGISALIGTSWGTFGMLIPLGLPMLVSFLGYTTVSLAQIPLFMPLLGAIISGSMVGNHLSPIADIMLMSATSSGAYHLDLVKSQMSFTLPAIFSTAVAFLTSGVLLKQYNLPLTALLSLIVGIVLNIILLHLLEWCWKKRA